MSDSENLVNIPVNAVLNIPDNGITDTVYNNIPSEIIIKNNQIRIIHSRTFGDYLRSFFFFILRVVFFIVLFVFSFGYLISSFGSVFSKNVVPVNNNSSIFTTLYNEVPVNNYIGTMDNLLNLSY